MTLHCRLTNATEIDECCLDVILICHLIPLLSCDKQGNSFCLTIVKPLLSVVLLAIIILAFVTKKLFVL